MSQQYGPRDQGAAGPDRRYGQPPPPPPPEHGGPPGPGGWGPGGWGPGGYPPGGRRQRGGSKRTRILVICGVALMVVVVIAGTVLLAAGGGDEPAAGPAPVRTLYTPPTASASPTESDVTRGPNDTGVEIGGGVWFTPTAGWVKDTKKRAGASYLLPEPGRPGAIDGWFWVRQSKVMGAKAFAEHLVDIESKNLQHVVIGRGYFRKCPSAALKACYATNYSAVVPVKGKKPVIFAGFVQSFEDQTGHTTATDAALQKEIYQAHKEEVLEMNRTLVRSF